MSQNIHTPSQHVLVKSSQNSAITAATAAGNTIDCQGFSRALVIINATPTGTGTTLDAKARSGAASDGSDAADITGGAFAQWTTAAGNKVKCMDIKILTNRYLTISATGAGGSAGGQYTITVILFNPGYYPVTQDVSVPAQITM